MGGSPDRALPRQPPCPRGDQTRIATTILLLCGLAFSAWAKAPAGYLVVEFKPRALGPFTHTVVGIQRPGQSSFFAHQIKDGAFPKLPELLRGGFNTVVRRINNHPRTDSYRVYRLPLDGDEAERLEQTLRGWSKEPSAGRYNILFNNCMTLAKRLLREATLEPPKWLMGTKGMERWLLKRGAERVSPTDGTAQAQ
ncbi:MAG: hypothetical protein H6707_04130 [Deltaproteobacteria bacterium]|nr:hypothetical protein [Deltaproteobacteria bacterium]